MNNFFLALHHLISHACRRFLEFIESIILRAMNSLNLNISSDHHLRLHMQNESRNFQEVLTMIKNNLFALSVDYYSRLAFKLSVKVSIKQMEMLSR